MRYQDSWWMSIGCQSGSNGHDGKMSIRILLILYYVVLVVNVDYVEIGLRNQGLMGVAEVTRSGVRAGSRRW